MNGAVGLGKRVLIHLKGIDFGNKGALSFNGVAVGDVVHVHKMTSIKLSI